ncbi:MAG: class I SAM-dependent methyltransferase [Candidatus Omnitrophica bacterium]|nr:class I SAM-dependent methyltransferase [Candidatus Omnitrophota bacterium]
MGKNVLSKFKVDTRNKTRIIKHCRICGNSNLKEFLKFKNLPVAGIYSIKKTLKENEFSLSLSLLYCENCGFVQIKEIVPAKIYTEYSYVGTYSNFYVDYLNWVCDFLIYKMNMKRKKILEIGCSNGYLLNRLKVFGQNDVSGYEPSKKLADECRKIDISVAQNYFSIDTIQNNNFDYDLIIIRHVIEHIDNLSEFLEAINKCLRKNGFLLVETPDIEEVFHKKLYSNIFHEHLNYFSRYSLIKLFDKYGFFPSYYKNVDIHGGSMFLIFHRNKKNSIYPLRKLEFSECKSFAKSLKKYYRKIRSLVKMSIKKGFRVYGYGAAHRTFSVLGITGLTNKEVKKIYDKNPFLHNKYIPRANILIDSPENIEKDKVRCLIIFATSFEDEIIKELKEKHGFCGKIISIKGIPKFIDINNLPSKTC